MTTNYFLTPVFHIVFRKINGEPARNGSVRFSKASDHNTRKEVYEDKNGTIPFPTIINLNNAGVIADVGGNPKPIYWASDEDYYVEVFEGLNATGTVIQTVDDYNSSLADFPTPAIEESNLTNYILNPQFRFFQEQTLNNSTLVSGSEVSIAEEGWFFYRDTANSTNQISFVEFAAGQTDVPYNPRYYLKFECSVAGAETRKDIVLPFRDVISFSGNATSHGWYVRSETGSATTLQLVIRQNFGAGGSAVVETILNTFTVTTSWTQITLENYTIPSVAGKTIGSGGDDRVEYCLRMPLNQTCIIGMVNGQMNLSNVLYDFNYTSAEEENIRKKAYEFPDPTPDDYGYQLVWNGTEYAYRNDTGKIEEWILGAQPAYTLVLSGTTYSRLAVIPNTPITYNRLYQAWDNDPDLQNGNAFGYGSDGFFPTLYSNTAIFTNTNSGTVTDWVDFNTGFTITTIQQSGTKGFISQFKPHNQLWYLDTLRVTNTANGNVTDTADVDTGFTFVKVQDGSGSQPEITDITTFAASTLSGGEHFLIDAVATPYYVWYKVDGVGADPAVGGKTGIKVEVLSTDTNAEVAQKTSKAISSYYFEVPDWRAYQLRMWANGSSLDPDRAVRVGQSGNIISGDHVGTIQPDEFRSHNHPTDPPASGNLYMRRTTINPGFAAGGVGSQVNQVEPEGGNETRDLNAYVLMTVKY